MRTWFWTFIVLVLAVALAVVLREHGGNVLIIAQPWRIELSLTLAVLLVVAAFIALYALLRFLAWLVSRPERLRAWREKRAQKKDSQQLESGWICLVEGRYGQVEQELGKLLVRSKSIHTKVLAGLALARASHHLGDYVRRDEALQVVRETAANEPRLREAAAMATAEMYLDQNRSQDALALLQPLHDAGSRHSHAATLMLRAYRQLGDHDKVYELTRLLLRRGVIDKAQALPLIESSAAARITAADIEGFKSVWGDLKSDEKLLPDIALAAAAVHDKAGRYEEAGKILEAALNIQLEARLLNAYSQCPPELVAKRLARAEGWLRAHPDNSDLLAELGNLCLNGQLWGPGERYLLRSMRIRSDVRIHALLGNLYDGLGRDADAMKHWRLASGVAGVLPLLRTSSILPAADLRGDPGLVDVGSVSDLDTPDARQGVLPIGASAADYLGDDDAYGYAAATADPPPASSVPSTDAESDFEEYFDSAPIPGVDVTQTSDRAGGNRNER